MLFNVSHNDKEITRKINDLVGKSYSWMERIRRKGIGSPRLIITEASPDIDQLLEKDNRRRYGNIELRPKGIIIGFRVGLEAYALVIPFHQLVIYKSEADGYSIYHHTQFVKVAPDAYDRPIHGFMSKLMMEKAAQSGTRIEDL
ncbi:MAG: hypothetical protein AAFP76_14935 [Bacteroidota bacterium]